MAILEETDQCWIYKLVTKDLCFQQPKEEAIRESLVLMREHALLNGLSEVHMPRLDAGLDRVEWRVTKQMLLEVSRDQPIRLTVHTPMTHVLAHKQGTRSRSISQDSEATLLRQLGLAERLSGHDLLNDTDTQSFFVNLGT